MKQYTIGLITGILLTASAFMFMGATQSDDRGNRPGRWQGMANNKNVFLLDTQTGELYKDANLKWRKRIKSFK